VILRRADIVLTDFSPARSDEANFVRPAVIITNNKANAVSPVVVVVPLTSNVDRIYPHELLLPNNRTNLDRDSKAQANLIRHVNVNRIVKRLGFVPDDLMLELDSRIREHLGL
jgi:mRNA interferase MazF